MVRLGALHTRVRQAGEKRGGLTVFAAWKLWQEETQKPRRAYGEEMQINRPLVVARDGRIERMSSTSLRTELSSSRPKKANSSITAATKVKPRHFFGSPVRTAT